MQFLLRLLIAYAGVGLVVSLAVHIASILGYQPGGDALFGLLHAGIFPLWIFVLLTINKTFSGMPRRKDFWKVAFAGCPPWMKYMTQGFFIYAIVNFFLFAITAPKGKLPAGGPPPAIWHGFSGHWVAFYSVGLAALTSAYTIGCSNLSRKCPNGHDVAWADAYCPTCGSQITQRAPGAI